MMMKILPNELLFVFGFFFEDLLFVERAEREVFKSPTLLNSQLSVLGRFGCGDSGSLHFPVPSAVRSFESAIFLSSCSDLDGESDVEAVPLPRPEFCFSNIICRYLPCSSIRSCRFL